MDNGSSHLVPGVDRTSMNVYVLKGVLLDASSPGTATALKRQVVGAISFPGFSNPTYDVLGVEFGLGVMEVTYKGRPATVKLQIWNVNEQKNAILSWHRYIIGSRIGIIAWNYSMDADVTLLGEMIVECLTKCPNIVIGIIMMHDVDGVSRFDSVGAIEPLLATIEHEHHVKATVDSSLAALMGSLVSQCLDSSPVIHVLPIRHLAELGRVPFIQNPFINLHTRVSDALVRFLVQQGVRIENDVVILDTPKYTFHVDLNDATLHAVPRYCSRCRNETCHDTFSNLCIELESPIKRGYASTGLGFTPTDLFVLSMVFAIQNDQLPPSVSGQLSRGGLCIWRR